MNLWIRDGGYYRSPVLKSLLVLTGATSLANYLLSVQGLRHQSIALLSVRVWALPTPGTWLMAAMILYYCRVLERREGSTKFLSKLCLSCAIGVGAAGLLSLGTQQRWAGLLTSVGSLFALMVSSLLVQYINTVVPLNANSVAGLKLSGNIPFFILFSYFSWCSSPSLLLTFCGIASGLVVHCTGLTSPVLPQWVERGLKRLLGREEPPRLYTGATVSVQRQQRMDEMERMMQQMQERQVFRQLRIGQPIPVQRAEPPAEQVEQLMGMGFSREDSVRALQHTGSNMTAAIQLLTARQH